MIYLPLAFFGLLCVLLRFAWFVVGLAFLRLVWYVSCFVCCESLFSSFGSFYMSCSAFFVLLCLGLLRPVTCLFVCLFDCLKDPLMIPLSPVDQLVAECPRYYSKV